MNGIVSNESSQHAATCFDSDIEIYAAEARVRNEPAVATHRWTLFQWLCIAREWKRALQQLQVFAQLDPSSTVIVHAYRDLVRAEVARGDVLAGVREPDYIFGDVPNWMRGLHAALELTALNQFDAADDARETALDAAPLVSGTGVVQQSDDAPAALKFSWIGDSDSRLGPTCEFIAAGRYRWLAFNDIASWRLTRPATLSDLVWTACTLALRDGTLLRGFMPARYPESEPPESTPDDRNALLMARKTIWRDVGRTGVVAYGAKTWMTSAGDIGLSEMTECVFNEAPIADARPAKN